MVHHPHEQFKIEWKMSLSMHVAPLPSCWTQGPFPSLTPLTCLFACMLISAGAGGNHHQPSGSPALGWKALINFSWCLRVTLLGGSPKIGVQENLKQTSFQLWNQTQEGFQTLTAKSVNVLVSPLLASASWPPHLVVLLSSLLLLLVAPLPPPRAWKV